MKGFVCLGFACVVAAVGAAAISTVVGQAPPVQGGAQSPVREVRPRQPGGLLTDHLGVYLTIEGVLAQGAKLETGTLLVDTVDGKKLDKPILLRVEGGYIAEHNLRSTWLDFPAKQRCILKGFENGSMIGVAPAIKGAAKEQGWKKVPMSPVGWEWRPYFVALVVVEPKGFELRKP